jgi:serine/threonine protein kinase
MNGCWLCEDRGLSPAQVLHLEQVCDHFEDAWKAATSREQRPMIENFLGDTPEPERGRLGFELVALELAYRRRAGEQPVLAEYQARFPQFADRLRVEFERTTSYEPLSKPPIGMDTTPPGDAPSTPDAETPRPVPHPASIGRYRVVQRLGQGGQAEVFRAVHRHLPGRDVVIKWARASLPEAAQRQLLAEGTVLARLEDPGLVRVYDVDTHEGRPFVVMEYVPGRNLQQQLKQGLPAPRAAADLVAQIAHTLDQVHRQGVYHRDLKPSNILIDVAGRPRVVDFGLALLDQPWEPAIRRAGDLSGTLPYLSPEQARGETDRIGARTDVFGLGCILYAVLTGRSPYVGDDPTTLLAQAAQGQIPAPRQLNPRIPRALDRICRKALARDPGERYASAGQMETALRRYLRRRMLAVILGVTVLLIAAVMALVSILPKRPASSASPVIARRLKGDLLVRIWSLDPKDNRGLRVDELDSGARPVLNCELVHVEAQLSDPANAYLLWLDREGKAYTLYPWS